MRIALIGYGKMGKTIEQIALQRGHEIVLKIDINNAHDLNGRTLSQADVAIEFTGPESAFQNVLHCLDAGVPVVCGSTGWLEKFEEARRICIEKNGTLLYASNFSVGVNLFFELNKKLARLMAPYKEYDVTLKEIHHTQKKDAPSGTAISLAEDIIDLLTRKKSWQNSLTNDPEVLAIKSERIDPAPGTHIVKYSSAIDDIEIIHTAHNRDGFATGAVLAAEFVKDRKGIFEMKDVLGFDS